VVALAPGLVPPVLAILETAMTANSRAGAIQTAEYHWARFQPHGYGQPMAQGGRRFWRLAGERGKMAEFVARKREKCQ
jgi:hypothetical protein